MTERKPPVEIPELGAETADTHAHLAMLDDPAAALEHAAVAEVAFIATVADVTEVPLATFESIDLWLSEAHERMESWAVFGNLPEIRIIVGAHPHNAKDFTPETRELLRELAGDPRVGAVGEIGLDYHYDYSPRETQRAVFAEQLGLANELGMPVAIHLRDAHEEGIAILRDVGVPSAGCIVHCFTEGPKTAEMVLEMGCHVSFAGPVTFAKADVIRSAAEIVPLDRLLTETDCPFMTPVPHRGRSNEPAWVTFNVQRLAEVKGLPVAQVAEATLANARQLLGSKP